MNLSEPTGTTQVQQSNRHNPHLQGPYAPIDGEFSFRKLKVTGEIPVELNGRYVRNGANPTAEVEDSAYYWIAGDGMVHGMRLKDGKALWANNRWIRSTAACEALGLPNIPGPRYPLTDNANTNAFLVGDKIFAAQEAGAWPVELDDELNSVAVNPFGGTLTVPYTGHPHWDPVAEELHAISYDITNNENYWHVVVNKKGECIREEKIPMEGGIAVAHDCQITDQYVLVFDLPGVPDLERLAQGAASPFNWKPTEHASRIGLLPRKGSGTDVIWCEVDPCFVFHPANAYETADGKVVVDLVVHETALEDEVYGPCVSGTRFERWKIDVQTRSVERCIIDDRAQEFPRYNERMTCKPYRYAYCVTMEDTGIPEAELAGHELLKHDLHRGTTQIRSFAEDEYLSEFVFVNRRPRGEGAAEDEGWLMGYVTNPSKNTAALYILNADDFNGEPQAIIHIPTHIPAGFHGNWIAERG